MNIDSIIKYLTGDMSPDEKTQFQTDLMKNEDLRREYEDTLMIWEEIRKRLSLEDKPDETDRELLLAEIMAERDLAMFEKEPVTKREKAFQAQLLDAMKEKTEETSRGRSLTLRLAPYITLAAAAMLALTVIILNPDPGVDALIENYYQPVTDPLFDPLVRASRSNQYSGTALFRQGNYIAARIAFEKELTVGVKDPKKRLLYALSCYETDQFDEAEKILHSIMTDQEIEIAETSEWYLSLITLQSGRQKEAVKYLSRIHEKGGKFKKEAGRLLRALKKEKSTPGE